MKIYWLNPPIRANNHSIDLAWMYYNSHNPEYEWVPPIFDWNKVSDITEVVEEIIDSNCQVLCFSTYVWNYKLSHCIVSEVKKRNPKIITIVGGPHQGYYKSYFEKYPYIDYLCHATSHGELFLKEALKQIKAHGIIKNPELVPYIISRDYIDIAKSTKFHWSGISPYFKNIDYIKKVVAANDKKSATTEILYETTRGCPYSCTFCEWGGGTSTKVVAKPLDEIEKDFELLSELGDITISITDANFGILGDRDVAVVDILSRLKKKNPLLKLVFFGTAKVKYEKKKRIVDAVFKADLTRYYSVSIQSVSQTVLDIIKRKDITVDENIELANYIKDTYNLDSFNIEIIIGLPGSTLDAFYEEMNIYQRVGCWYYTRAIATVLPDSELGDLFYQKVNGIVTAEIGHIENEDEPELFDNSILGKYKSSWNVIIASNSFTFNDWKQMIIMSRAQRIIGPHIPNTESASDVLKSVWQAIQVMDWYEEYDKYLDLVPSGALADKHINMFNDKNIDKCIESDKYRIMALAGLSL